MRKWLDMPPVWLLGSMALVYALGWVLPVGGFGMMAAAGPGLFVTGLALVLAAAGQMIVQRTTVIPREQPAVLVTGGLFHLSRNPIYLGDAMMLAGVILWRDVVLAVPVLIAFVWVIRMRFINGEEARLRAGFGAAYNEFFARTGRWIAFL